MTATVDILIPTYNSTRFLRPALDSALSQQFEDVRVVVVDNASTDGTPELVRDYAASDARVELHENARNIGPVANFHRCFELANAPLMKYLMSDDVLHPGAVRRLAAPLLDDPEVVLATSRRERIDEDGRVIEDARATQGLGSVDRIVPGGELADLLVERCTNLIGEPTTTLFRRDAVSRDELFSYYGFRPRVIADVALWMTLLERGSCAWIAEPLSQFRSHPNQDQRSGGLSLLGHMEWAQLRRLALRHGHLRTRAQRLRGLRAAPALLPFHLAALVRPARIDQLPQGART